MENLAEEVVQQFRDAIEAEGSAWVSAAIPFEVADMRISAGVAYYAEPDGTVSGLYLDIVRCAAIARELTAAISESTGSEVRRVRLNVASDWSVSVDHFGPRLDPDDIGLHFGVWPDEPGYEGRVFVRPEIERVDSWQYSQVAGSAGVVAGSLARIGGWLEANEAEYAALLNPPASAADLDRFEQELGVVLPASVREAWLIHDGQSGRGVLHYTWLPVAQSADQLQYFSSRSDGGEGLIPIMTFDGIVLFVESVSEPGLDGPVWLWEANTHRDERLADSFGQYLAWFAEECEAGNITGELLQSVLVHRDHV